jgi:hypothetical protein
MLFFSSLSQSYNTHIKKVEDSKIYVENALIRNNIDNKNLKESILSTFSQSTEMIKSSSNWNILLVFVLVAQVFL